QGDELEALQHPVGPQQLGAQQQAALPIDGQAVAEAVFVPGGDLDDLYGAAGHPVAAGAAQQVEALDAGQPLLEKPVLLEQAFEALAGVDAGEAIAAADDLPGDAVEVLEALEIPVAITEVGEAQ